MNLVKKNDICLFGCQKQIHEQNNNENNNASGRYIFNTINRAFNNTNSKSQLGRTFLDGKTNNDENKENTGRMNNSNKFRNFPKYNVIKF